MGATPDLKADPQNEHGRDELGELRALLLGQQIVELEELRKRLDNPDVRAEEVSRILGQAIALAAKQSDSVRRQFYPIVEQALKISVTKNPAIITTSLAPIIGETVRKAVADAFRNLVESINVMVERSFSWKALMWRLEALRTGKSFGEIVVLRSLNYKVRQVFLIQRGTGAVLQYVTDPGEGIREAELASSMLTALGDFVTDAFTANRTQEVGKVETTDFIIWVQYGPQALLAANIVGTPPRELKTLFARENERIHQEFATALASFSGDATVFDAARPHLERCLVGQRDVSRKRLGAWVWVTALLLMAALGGLAMFVHRRNTRWQQYLARLGSEPGIVVTSASKGWRHYSVAGLRDPMAADPQQLATPYGIAPERLSVHFEPYQSLDSSFARERQFDAGKEQIESEEVLFPVNSSALSLDQETKLDLLERQLHRLQDTARTLGREIHLEIYGRADQTGVESKNVRLSQQRAERVRGALIDRGVAPEMLTGTGLGDSQPIRQGSTSHQLQVNRSVLLKVDVSSKGK